MYFDQDHAIEIQRARKAYISIRKLLKDVPRCSLAKSRVVFDCSPIIHNSATTSIQQEDRTAARLQQKVVTAKVEHLYLT